MKKLLQMFALVALMAIPWATNAQSGWCTPSPSTKDGSGITNVTFGAGSETVNTSVTWSSAPFYNDYRSQIGAVAAGTTCEMSITYATGYSYGTIIWVDWNNDSTFSGTEVVWVGTSLSTNPTTMFVNFNIAPSQDTGTYAMRICAADMAFDNYTSSIAAAATVDPCGSYSWGVALDFTLRVTEAPSCVAIENLAAIADSNSITLSWTDLINSGASYSIEYWPEGASAGDTLTATTSANTITINGLESNTLYHFSVKAVCSSTDESLPRSISMRTACGQITLPYFVDFEDAAYNGAWYPCWDSAIHAGTDPSVNTTAAHNSTYGMYFQGNSSENYNLVVSPIVPTAGNNIYVRFWGYLTNSSGWMKAGVMTNPHDTSTFIPMVNVVGNSWNEYEFRTDTLDATATYYVAWLACIPGAYYNTQIGRIDDVYISEAPTCARVPALTIDTTTTDAITLHWADNGSNSYTVYYWVTGSTDTLYTTVSDTTATLSGLQSLTGYSLYVVANCTGGDAEPSPVYTAGTTCAASTCNMTVNATDSYGDGWNGNAIEFYQAGVLVGSATIASGSSATETVEVCSSAPVEVRFHLGSYAYEMGGTVTDGGSNTVFTISGMDSYSNGALLATVAVPCPNCLPPTEIYLSDTTASGVTIHWTAQAGQTAWIVRVDSTDYNVTNPFFTATGLAARTAHTIAVATDCSGDTSSFISLPFITGCASEECEITVTSSDEYNWGNYYSPILHVYQNGAALATVQNATQTIDVCSGMAVNIIYGAPSSTYSTPMATIIDGGDEEVFNGATSSYTTGDTLVYLANACPSCLKPSGVHAMQVDSNQITFVWNIEGGYSYQISFDSSAYITNNNGVYTAYGLISNTLHTFAVRTICDLGDTSNAHVITVKTACGEMGIPYTEGFENDADGTVPSCWNVVSAGDANTPAVGGDAHNGNHSLNMASDASHTAMIASSAIPLAGDSIKVKFWASVEYGYGSLEAGVMTNPQYDTTFISLINTNASSYTEYEFNTTTLDHDSTYYLAFRYTYNGTYSYGAYIDDVNISLYEGCMTPSNVIVTADSANATLTVTWANSGTVNAYVVSYSAFGSNTWSLPQFTVVPTKTLTGLNYSTTYEVRVGQVCGIDTLWAAPVTATTVCGLAAVPYLEVFNSPDGSLPPCWYVSNANKIKYDNWPYSSGNGALQGGNYSAGEYAVLPKLAAPIVKLEISYDAKLGNISEGDGMMMGVFDDATNTVTWLDTLQMPGQCRENYVRFTYNYTNYSGGQGDRIAIGHSHDNPSDWGFYVDSIVVIALNDCLPPDSVTANNTSYPYTADFVNFTWHANGPATQWQVYIDTIDSNIDIDSVPNSQLILVDTNFYQPAINTLAEGAMYRFFVRGYCGPGVYSNWVELQNGFATDSYVMNQHAGSIVFDTITGCDFIIYDNGGSVAGYEHNSYSGVIIQAGEEGRQLQLQGAFFNTGDDQATFTVYDSIGTNGTVLYTRQASNAHDQFDYFDSVLATSTTGAMTITFTSGYYAALGYELYIHCVGTANCPKPTNLMVAMTSDSTAHATWDATGASLYRVYHRTVGDLIWNMNPAYTNSYDFTNLPVDAQYEFRVVAYCSANDSSASSITRVFNTHWEAPCFAPDGLQVSDLTQTEATLNWTGTGNLWEVAMVGNSNTVTTTNTSYTFTGLTANTQYSVRVRNICDSAAGRYSEWSDTLNFTTLSVDVTYYTITVSANNNEWGTVTGGGTYPEGTVITITASANAGYHFDMWQDGITTPSRTITVNGDYNYVANFAQDGHENTYYTITVTSNNTSWGTVTGGGTYADGTSCTIKATARPNYHFVKWQEDNNTNSERTITVTADATYTAIFAENVGIDGVESTSVVLFPNPANTMVTIRGIESGSTVTVVDLNGREMYKANASNSLTIDVSGYAKGAYLVRITGERTAAIRKLIVE